MKIEFIDTTPPVVQEYMLMLNREIARAFTPPCYLPPKQRHEFMVQADCNTATIRAELLRLTMLHKVPLGIVFYHGDGK